MLLRADATVGVCCLNGGSVEGKPGEDLYLYDGKLQGAFQSKFFQEIRESMERGERHPSCQACWGVEDMGLQSKRQLDNEIYAHRVREWQEGKALAQPIDMSLNLGTLCNLKCRVCSSGSSSRYAQEYLDLFGEDHIPRRSAYMRSLPDEEVRALTVNWPYKNQEMTDTIFQWLPEMERMEFLGGEPFLNKKHFEIVREAVKRGLAPRQTLRYVTNGTIFPEELARDVWPHFKAINVNVSADGIGPHFEYQRHGAKWDEAVANIERYRKISNVYLVQVYLNISMFSIYYLPEIFSFWHSRGIHVCTQHILNPERLNVRVMPKELKERVKAKLLGDLPRLPEKYQLEIKLAVDYMMSEDHSHLWPRFIESVWFHDNYRKEDFAATFPEFNLEMLELGIWYDYTTQKEYFFPNEART